jgi:ABC-type multidrug transport system fused ATPase/permease subunit
MVKPTKNVLILGVLIFILAAFAAGAGLWWQNPGESYTFTTIRGEEVIIEGQGLYRYDSVSIVAQAKAQDLVTLVVGLPMLLAGLWFYRKGSLRGSLLLAGTFGYLLYTYLSYCMLSSFNELFLVYVVLFTFNLFALIGTILSINVSALPEQFTSKTPVKAIATLLFVMAGFLFLAWGGRIIPALINGETPVGLDNATTLVIQVLDLGLIVPFSLVGGLLLLKRKPLGYLTANIMLFKGISMATAVSTMAVNMLLNDIPVSPVELIVFPLLNVAIIIMTILLFRNIRETKSA